MDDQDQEKVSGMLARIAENILRQYRPASKPVADYEPTTEELARAISRTVPISLTQLSVALTLRGFKVRRIGTEFRWQMDFTDLQ